MLGNSQRALARDREASGLAGLADLRRGRGGVVGSGLLGWGLLASGGGKGEEEEEDEGEKEYGGHEGKKAQQQ